MKAKFILFLFVLVGFSLQAQSSYTLNPGNTVSGSVAMNDYLALDISMLNTTGSDIFLEYELVLNTCSSNWDIVMCDFPNCFPFVPASGQMGAVARGTEGFLKLTINPLADPGIGQIVYKVWEASNPTLIDTVTFNIDVLTKIDSKTLANAISVYPNPTSDVLNIDLGKHLRADSQFKLFAMDGKLLMQSEMPVNGKLSLSIKALPKGIYMLQVSDKNDLYSGRVLVD